MDTPSSTTWTVGRLLRWTTQYLSEHGSESPRLDAEVLLACARGCARIELYVQFDAEVEAGVRARFRELVRHRAEGEPVAYLVGHKEFYSLDFEVCPAVLIPRPDSELVVMQFLELARTYATPTVVDVGTGTGNIAIAVAAHHTGARLIAVDASVEALELAGRNARRHGVAGRIEFQQSDLLDGIAADVQLDFVLSNPPYIATKDISQLPAGVRNYEPHLALDGGEHGTEVVGRLIGQSSDRLQPQGYLVVEIGAPQEQAVCELIARNAAYESPSVVKDYSGHPRVVWARKRRQS